MNWLFQVAAGFRLQLALTRRTPAQMLVLVTAPLFSTIFLSLAVHHNSTRIVDVVMGAGFIGIWAISLDIAGSALNSDRWGGQLELLLGAPIQLSLVVLGRILAVSMVGMLTFVESWLVATVAFGVTVPIENPALVALALALTAVGSAATATLLASAFVLSRSVHVFQNSMSYPIYILGGIVVPVAALQDWVQPISTVVYLSWVSDLLRGAAGSAQPEHVVLDTAMALVLTAAALTAGILLAARFTRRLRVSATAGHG